MPVPVTPWAEWIESVPGLAGDRTQIAGAVAELQRRHPARRAFWGDDFAWELSATGLLEERVATQLTTTSRDIPVLRLGVDPDVPAPPEATGTETARSVLLASTPRSGNTIVRRMIGQLGLHEYALHDLDDMVWHAAPRPFVVQHHIGPDDRSLRFVDEERLTVVTAVRHPLDVLCSVRAFSRREPACRYWLDGAVELAGVDLSDDTEFERWATSDAADALLEVSTAWSQQPGVVVIRHEDVAEDPASVSAVLAGTLGAEAGPVSYTEASEGIPDVHRTSAGPGAWRSLPDRLAATLASRHRRHLETLGYLV